ncbi:anthrone oxygenase family protein [Neolewinella litorea]|uniref:DUF1772 domain-containing protein n=1 Tax=Neolewinella litorea TaxID=2562452 RepID=A0A4S4NKR1_9BACT|nr:anthrone oxygenase family protein [Neolewinella litorea]THH40486.1 DUF1772 domain-containing protein [Neolewinella litorea]
MTTLFILWLTVLFFAFHLAGHLFDMRANQPNWRSAEPDAVKRYRDFYRVSSPRQFFAPLVIGCPLAALAALAFAWEYGGAALGYLTLTFCTGLAVLILTVVYFVPVNKYLFTAESLDAGRLKKRTAFWMSLEYVRVSLLVVGLLAAILALEDFRTLT